MIKRFFIVSTGRTGTRSLASSLNKINGIRATHERLPKARDISNRLWDYDMGVDEAKIEISQSLNEYDEFISTKRSIYSHNIFKRLLKFLLNTFTGKYTYEVAIDSNCLVWNFTDLLDNICERKVGYIYVYRTAQDTIDSMFASPFYRAQGSVSWERRATRGFIDITTSEYSESDRYKNCEYGYRIRTEQIEKSLSEIDAERQIKIKFEELISNEQVPAEIIRFVSDLSGLNIRRIPKLAHENRRPR